MKIQELLQIRLNNQLLSQHPFDSVEKVVAWMGAMQAQDYAGAKWSIGLRLPGSADGDIEKAIASKRIIRTWPMRGTLHFVAAEDARWMLKLLTPRVITSSAGRHRQLKLDDRAFARSTELIVRALQGGKQLMRSDIFGILAQNGIETANQRGMHIIGWLAQNQIICHGSHNEKQPTYALMDEWVPKLQEFDEAEALGKLAVRFFKSHGPASLRDFAWWAGLKISDAKTGILLASDLLEAFESDGNMYYVAAEAMNTVLSEDVYLLPGFDEYMLGYTDRTLILKKEHFDRIVPGNNGMFMPTLVSKGKVEGTWKRTFKKEKVVIDMFPFGKMSSSRKKSFEVKARKFCKYLDKPMEPIVWH